MPNDFLIVRKRLFTFWTSVYNVGQFIYTNLKLQAERIFVI